MIFEGIKDKKVIEAKFKSCLRKKFSSENYVKKVKTEFNWGDKIEMDFHVIKMKVRTEKDETIRLFI